ncbi:hypothetical protein [Clostridium sp.]|uniref:hypothetical protein n=1 Tax=Clostridium sp. TaxID=1506 RepID=UPI002FCADD53
MKKVSEQLLLVLVLCTLMMSILPLIASANSAEPPSLVILINNPPEDLSITLISNRNPPEAKVRKVAWEGYYVFYSRDMQVNGVYTFKVTTKGESFERTISTPLQHYNNVFTLDMLNRELTPGKYQFRSMILISIRVALTLLIEGIIFWLFKFRQKRSWLIFLVINLVTQGALNALLNNGGSLMPSYLIFGLIVGEVFVFIAEIIAFSIFIKEYKKVYILNYVLIANLISLIVGSYIITVLPV